MVLFFTLFLNYYSKAIFKEALSNRGKGININGSVVNHIRYVYDT